MGRKCLFMPVGCRSVKFMPCYYGRSEGRASRAAAWGANPLGALRRHWNNLKCGASKVRFPHATQFLRKLFTNSARAVKKVRQPSPRPQNLEAYRFEGARGAHVTSSRP